MKVPTILRYSLFTTLMSMTEASIVGLCSIVRHIFGKEPFNRRGNNVIKRAIEYLEIEDNEYKDFLDVVNSLRDLRNCIVHSQGYISLSKENEANNLEAV
jgi:hypothetical protein